MQETVPSLKNSNQVLSLEKYRLKLKLRDEGVEWHEDQAGKFKIWLRLSPEAHVAQN